MNFLLNLIPGFSFFRLGVAAVIITVAVGAAWKWRHGGVVQGRGEIQAQWDAEKLDIAKQTLRVYENNTRTEQNLIASSETTRRTKDARIAQLDANLIIALNGLRDRPERVACSAVVESARSLNQPSSAITVPVPWFCVPKVFAALVATLRGCWPPYLNRVA